MGLFKKVAKAVLPAVGSFVGSKLGGFGGIGQALGSGLASGINTGGGGWDAEDAFDANAALQREFAQYGIRWRVEDAKAAGVHPVYALGAGGAAAAPISVMDSPRDDWSGRMGQDLGRAVTAQMDPMQRRLQEAQLKVLESEAAKNNALALGALGSRGATANQPGNGPAFPAPYGPGGFDESGMPTLYGPTEVLSQDAVQYKPVGLESRRGDDFSMVAGSAAPAVQEFLLSPSTPMLLPSKDAAERLESLSESWELAYAFLQLGAERYGQQWLDGMKRYFPVTSRIAQVINNVQNAFTWMEPVERHWVEYMRRKEEGFTYPGERNRRMDWLKKHGLSARTVWTGKGRPPWERR